MIEPVFWIGWSVGGLSMIIVDMLWNTWDDYMKALKASKCKCKCKEE